ncbi:uncharacterized protein LOC126854380 [Cataglyphis hispanica]|uniref:uncharacterized protein LOC126854380 n=1 Tax=Cataglyphis hispanica TaxID=1086592 RepID=UPI00217F40FD|nr:uncharacterized protein LOC126854380 [Cataglyphis hispanica]
MMKFCPLCIKNGLKRKVKAFQLNFEEATWSCETENCPWPIGYEETTFFQRNAFTCNWNEELSPPIGIPEESISTTMELLLYTPPVTPGGELSKESIDNANTEYLINPSSENKVDETLVKNKVIYSTKEPTGFLPTSELSETESNNILKERRNSTKEENISVNVSKALPRITNIQKAHLDVTFLLKNDKCDDKKIHKSKDPPIDATMINIAENTLFENMLCKEVDLDRQCNIESTQNKNSELSDKMNEAETNLNTELLPETDKPMVDANDINNLNTINNSSLNISDVNLSIDNIIEDILSTENHITENINNDWLRSLIDM